MKALKNLFKIMTALAAIAGAVYVIAVYGDKIVAWAKKLLDRCPCFNHNDFEDDFEFDFDEEFSPAVEVPFAPPAEEAPVEETAAEDEVVINEAEPVAEDHDFEG